MKRFLHSPVASALCAALLFLPLKDLKSAVILFVFVLAGISAAPYIRKLKIPQIPFKASGLSGFLPVLTITIFALLPFALKDYYLDVLIMFGIYALLALGLNVIVGFTGQLNLGFAAFYAIGAYTYALLNTRLGLGFWPSLPIAACFASLSGLVLGVPALRLKGDYLAIVTLGFGEIVRIVLNNWDTFTKGPNGIAGIEPPYIAGFSLGKLQYYYYLVFMVVIAAVFVIRRIEFSKTGRAWLAIKENEIAASTMGIDTTAYKLYAFAFGTFWAGIAGTLFAAKMQFVSPESFTFMESVLILSMVILGGIGNVYGSILGAFILVIMPELLRDAQLYRMLILGLCLVVLMIFRPQGLIGAKDASAGR
ncbi:MAG: branched-chain amino acid ABC transporter permease [Nitrospirae bacterium]|nr:branched-chain amino acid ABC transporter permease [Nitrospirota bacterium]